MTCTPPFPDRRRPGRAVAALLALGAVTVAGQGPAEAVAFGAVPSAAFAAVPTAGFAAVPSAAGAPAGAPAGPVALPQLWRWPLLPAPRVLRAFDPPAKPWLPGHRGVDLAAFPGQPVLSAATGVVVFAGPLAGRGVVSVEYGGIRSSYEPVVPLVRPGDRVVVGQPVGLVAPLPVHCGTRTCLHWGAFASLSVPRRYLDPRSLVGAGPVRLVPPGGRRPLTGWAATWDRTPGPPARPVEPAGSPPAAVVSPAAAPPPPAGDRPVGSGRVVSGAVAGLTVAAAVGLAAGRLRRRSPT